MSQPPFRFVHASDLHLERPLGGIAHVAGPLRELFLEAPYEAAAQVFETVLSEKADALVLAGDIVNFDLVGPRAVVFLQQQFQRLADHNVPVYWACGEADPAGSWPASVPLPENVTLFPVGRAQTYKLARAGTVLAKIQGVSRSQAHPPKGNPFEHTSDGLFTIGVASPGEGNQKMVKNQAVDYLALGGQHQRRTLGTETAGRIAHYCGSPQGRTPEETEAHGCTLVTVDDAGSIKTSLIATDSIRWITETVEVTAGTDEDALLAQLENRISKLQIKHSGSRLLITWKITGRGQVLNHIRRGGISDQMTERLCQQYGSRTPLIWTVALQCHEPLDVPQEWVDEETIMGDMLREFRALEADPDLPLQLEEFLPAELLSSPRAELAAVGDDQRAGLLWAASKMAVDMLDGEEKLLDDEEKILDGEETVAS